MNLTKFLSRFNSEQLESIVENALVASVEMSGGTIEDARQDLEAQVETQYTWVRKKVIRKPLAAINMTRPCSWQSDEEHDEWLEMITGWAKQ